MTPEEAKATGVELYAAILQAIANWRALTGEPLDNLGYLNRTIQWPAPNCPPAPRMGEDLANWVDEMAFLFGEFRAANFGAWVSDFRTDYDDLPRCQ